jgi:hypothetical protein
MPVFVVTRSGDKEPLLLIDAADEVQAIEHVNNLDMIGVLHANGYRKVVGSCTATLASGRQVARWTAGNFASASGPGRKAPNRSDHIPAYVHFIAPADFKPSDEDRDELPLHQRA